VRGALLGGAALTAGGLPGLLPGGAGAFDPLALAAWLALVAAPLGVLAGGCLAGALRAGRGARALTWVLAAPICWALALALTAAGEAGAARLPEPLAAAIAVGGLWALGIGLGALGGPRRAGPWAALTALLALLLALLPTGAGALAQPWPPALAARLLDLSPLTFVLERAGLDWMRHPAVYDALGAASIGPDLRRAGSGALAPGLLSVVGCALVAASWAVRRRGSPHQQ
jgi:hypothetical protein